ncbi:disulfide bond formation protein DsbA [Sphingopyxis bauzanensis]|jgi:2-hydroxychromene-2-carboxylate isomerase|uniref:2-hydroxychromene-2-carboxylate isomerase n=1 Tax=Sphingopyxis bauzanensis TaxID=651663 RepID=A0A246JWJ9_9SPHN|nr:2-hydroxychromene-2-carboxylate isomerase [Sphingopyxis bauzanensis]OWQ97353.1 disulfide bond formation protein DsbA [Sphingopyxis bauzanensis]GGJ37400.1 2-hydroxychromene-2-carboxylate isomerase [Sphingopyxis bauzanensis]
MVTKTLELIFDFGSPNAYLAMKALPELLDRTGADLLITPCLLGGVFKATGNKAPMIQYADAPAKLAYENLEMRRFVEKHDLGKFRLNPHFPINTLTIMRGAIVATDEDVLDDYVDAVNRAMWEDGLKMDDADVVATFLSANGFDGPALLARTQEPEIKAKLVANTEVAVARGVFGIPTFFVGDAMFFGKDRLGQVEEALA